MGKEAYFGHQPWFSTPAGHKRDACATDGVDHASRLFCEIKLSSALQQARRLCYDDARFGRMTQARVTTLGIGVDGAVQRIASLGAPAIRPVNMTYPNARVLSYDYGAAGGINDRTSRVESILEQASSIALAKHSYLGQSTIVEVDYTEPDMKYTLVDLNGTNDPDTAAVVVHKD
jgi:hypothetical protein